MLKSFKELLVWKEAIKLVEMVYVQSKIFPKEELYGIVSQMRRAAVSIPANISEGYARKTRKEYIYFLSISTGSIAELETYLIISERLNYLPKEIIDELQNKLDSVSKMLSALKRGLES